MAAWEGEEFADALEVDEGGAADAEEEVGGEEFFEAPHGFAEDMVGFADMQDGVVAGGFDPVDFVESDKDDAVIGTDHEASLFGRGGGVLVEPVGKALVVGAGGLLGEGAAGAIDGLLEAGEFEGFEEVIGGVDLEGLEGEFVVGGGEDDGGLEGIGEVAEDFEAGHAGHLDIEEDEVGLVGGDGIEGFLSVGGFGEELGVGDLGEELADPFAGEGFVIGDKGGEGHAVGRGRGEG